MWMLLFPAFALPEVCDGLDNDANGFVDDGAGCSGSSLLDASTGHAYTVLPAGPGSEADAACGSIGYHPADPNSAAENSLLAAFDDGTLYWMGIRIGDTGDFVDSGGNPLTFTAWVTTPTDFVGCSQIGDIDADGVMEWDWASTSGCSASLPYLCEADCTLTTVYLDGDGDGWGQDGTATSACGPVQPGFAAVDGDCDDLESLAYPGSDELCDGIDNDCDHEVDEDAVDTQMWYLDEDGDGAGDDDSGIESCDPIADRVMVGGDCEPLDPLIHPSAPEACADNIDNDCDGLIDSDDPDFQAGGVLFWFDNDGDGYGSSGDAYTGCSGTQPLGYVSAGVGEDCDDANDQNSPGLQEVCDGQDNNCDNLVDNGLSFVDYWPDVDEDGFGDENAVGINVCTPPDGLVRNQLDCDDTDPDIKPFIDEVCDAVDHNCNNLLYDGLPTTDYWPDTDEDGFGDGTQDVESTCYVPDDKVANGDDCDDSDANVYPHAPDDPDDGIDSDCDGTVEHGPPAPLVDTDGDSIPDVIDPTPDGYTPEAGPEPTPADYGCGCSATRSSPWWFGGIRR